MSSDVYVADECLTYTPCHQLTDFKNKRVAIVHHWFVSLAGGERVVNTIASLFPHADVFTLFLDKQKLPSGLRQHKITTSILDKIPAARRVHRHFLPFYPLAVEMLDLSGYDYGRPVIAFGKGGALETVVGSYTPPCHPSNGEEPAITGIFFREQTADSLANAILTFESCEEMFLPQRIQLHARKFDTSVFLDRMRSYVNRIMGRTL